MRKFTLSLRGRTKNFKLPKNQPLIPLFEAIVNSIHAIDERRAEDDRFNGHIIIRIIRSDQIVMDNIELPPISSFEIIDNGVGFNEQNLTSFMESDSTYKALIGGKGVGRLSWLIAFEKAEIESVYTENGKYLRREFDFAIDQSEINDEFTMCDEQNDNCTTVRLVNCLSPYADSLPKRAETIAMRILQHCLVYFISDDCPQIDLIDDGEKLNLNGIFKEKIHTQENTTLIRVGNEDFELLHFKAENVSDSGNKLYLCAHNRLVETKDLDKYVADLDREIFSRSGFWYIGVLRGKALDESVDMNRLSFDIPNGGELESLAGIITMDQIMKSVSSAVGEFLQDYLQPIAANKMKRITDYVTGKAPQYRHLLKHEPDAVSRIKPNLSDDRLDDELHNIKRDFDRRIAQENARILEDLNKGVIHSKDYEERFNRQIERINDANCSALAEYVAHRRVILDLMEFAIRKNDDGKFKKESFIHNIIYPTRATSTELPYSNHNLWLIDEKLSYCSYISSDIPFSNSPQEKRTDIMILDNPVAVSDETNQGKEYDTIVIFELKRPMRDDYNNGDNPIEQLYTYVDKLKTNKVKDKNGRPIMVGANTKFYLYAVCDVTGSLIRVLDHSDFSQTPDKLGYYRYHDKLNAYVEVISYDKIINDAKKRNKILFDKLGI